ncbi:hypothetical protein SBC1_14290 [Caballeronia sp. SBC1]|uniref:hypothetical protein n=1 Tax=unclassified Caballeronia TaxID=2646786 RepID=UPI0013E1EDFD|nr:MULTISPECIES: hypothetical protein [unclassified Caballeronia]QIE23542.1 hypothetical protein SBC2_15680 [Caballeronia sp. SBC2]QIN61437.1 hypothetical protein SBC1_14290 [Caballeronia sp. SBC1]
MQTEDKDEFIKALDLCCSTLSKPLPDPASLKFFFKLLAPYSLADVRAALIHHMQTCKYAPAPVDVIAYVDKSIDCWVSPDEAFAIAKLAYAKPCEEQQNTVIICNEIEQALDHVRHLLDEGSNYDASRAFKDVYARIADIARQKRAKPHWRISLGADKSQREVVIRKAVNEGRIALADGRAACPLLAGPGDDDPIDPKTAAEGHSKIADILAMLTKPREHKVVADMAGDIAATREAASEQARKAAEYVQAQQRSKDEAEAYRMIASLVHLPDGELAAVVRLMAGHVVVE